MRNAANTGMRVSAGQEGHAACHYRRSAAGRALDSSPFASAIGVPALAVILLLRVADAE